MGHFRQLLIFDRFLAMSSAIASSSREVSFLNYASNERAPRAMSISACSAIPTLYSSSSKRRA
jgi:hypothetical protein